MRTYEDKEDLKNEIRQSFERYISEFDTIPEALKDKRVPEVDRTPAESFSSTRVESPARAAYRAAVYPAGPPPMTIIS